MSEPGTTAVGRVGEALLYVFGAWIALTVLILALPWAPEEPLMQSARLVLLFASVIALLISVVGAGSGLLGLFGMSVKDPAPKP